LPASPLYRNLSDAVNVNQNIFDFGLTRHATSAARHEAEAAQQDVAEVRIQVSERAKQAFLKVLGAQQAIKVKEQSLRERQEILRKVEEFFQAGLSSKLDVNLAEVGRSTAELALSQARHAEQIAWADLFAALGQAEGEHYDLVEPEFHPASPGELEDEIKQALVNRPDLKSFQAEIEAQQERVEYAHSLRRPILKGVWSGGYARFAELTASRLMVGGLGLFAPLYTGGELGARVQEEERILEALRGQYSSRVLEVRAEVSRAHAELLNALESAAANQKISEYAEAALRLARTRHQAQLASFVELTTAETATEQARTDYAQALYGFRIARAHLDAAIGLQP
jgi:outer membrane protein